MGGLGIPEEYELQRSSLRRCLSLVCRTCRMTCRHNGRWTVEWQLLCLVDTHHRPSACPLIHVPSPPPTPAIHEMASESHSSFSTGAIAYLDSYGTLTNAHHADLSGTSRSPADRFSTLSSPGRAPVHKVTSPTHLSRQGTWSVRRLGAPHLKPCWRCPRLDAESGRA